MNEEIKKKINVNNGKISSYTDSRFIQIQYTVLEKQEKKILRFNMWDDFSFSGFQIGMNYNERKLEFEINNENPLYEPLLKFLNNEKEILIDDDESRNK
jgi:hypothetical protein